MANQTLGLREDLYNVTCKITGIDGTVFRFTADKFDGGDVSAKETKYRPANGTVDQLSLGGAQEVSNVSVTAIMRQNIYTALPWILTQVGKARIEVTKQPTDRNGAAFGKPLVYRGNFQGCNPPKTDSESDAPSLITFMQSSVTPINAG